MTPKARPVRLALAAAIVVLVAAMGASWLWLRQGGHTATRPVPPRYAGALTLVSPSNWPGPAWPIEPGIGNGLLWSALLDTDAKGNFFPELAAQIPSLANGGVKVVNGQEVITFRLKRNLRWSDGTPITAADYIAAIVYGSAPEVGFFAPRASSAPSAFFCPFRTVRIVGATLVITLRGTDPAAVGQCNFYPAPWEYLQRKYGLHIPAALTTSYDVNRVVSMYSDHTYQGSPLQRLITRSLADPYMSARDLVNGPFRIVSWSQNGPDVVAPNPYYGAMPPDPHHPLPATIRLLTPSGDPAANTHAMLAGTLPAHADLVSLGSMPASGLPATVRSYRPYQLDLVGTATSEHLALNQANSALRDQRVRLALLYAIDKVAYLQEMFHLGAADAAAIALASPFPSSVRFSINNQFPVNLYDPARARALLAAAGYATSSTGPGRHLQLAFYTTTAPGREQSARILQRYWRRVGVMVELHFVSIQGTGGLFGAYSNGGILANGHFDIAEFAWTFGSDAGLLYDQVDDPGQVPDRNHPTGSNDSAVRDHVLFSFLDQAQHTLDDAVRGRLYAGFQRYAVAQAYEIPLYSSANIIFVKPTIGNFNPYGGNADYFWNAFQWYVR